MGMTTWDGLPLWPIWGRTTWDGLTLMPILGNDNLGCRLPIFELIILELNSYLMTVPWTEGHPSEG
eukprot:247213-Amphidinium_carterae.1